MQTIGMAARGFAMLACSIPQTFRVMPGFSRAFSHVPRNT
jgi:hypothetical protein